jgi:NAD(P)-dependent dehydrogenase (short-subunit alcohol dehydrogenase family)
MSNDSLLNRLFSLKGKTALVTGASGGIGRALAVALGGAGAAVGVHGRDDADLAETRKQVDAAGGRGVILKADIADVAACRRLTDDTVRQLGRLDVLVNCAGINFRNPLADATEDEFEKIFAVNLRGLFFLCQAAYPVMKAQGGGKIVNVGSITTTWGLGGVGVYGMTKSAVGHLTKTLAVEWAADNIQVNCLAPGFIVTPLTEKALFGDPHRRKWILDRTPARRPGKPQDLVGTLLLLSSPGSDFITGQIITVDGGFVAGGWWKPED